MTEVNILFENQTKQPRAEKVTKVGKDSDIESSICHHDSRPSLGDRLYEDYRAFSAALL